MAKQDEIKLQENLEKFIKDQQKAASSGQVRLGTSLEEFAKSNEVSRLVRMVEDLKREFNEIKKGLGLTSIASFHASLKGRDGKPGKDGIGLLGPAGAPGRPGRDADENRVATRVLERLKAMKPDEKPKTDNLKQIKADIESLKARPTQILGGGGGGGDTWEPLFNLTGDVDGDNTSFTVPGTYANIKENSEEIILNGLTLLRGSGNDYTISLAPNENGSTKATITFITAPPADGQSPRIKYIHG